MIAWIRDNPGKSLGYTAVTLFLTAFAWVAYKGLTTPCIALIPGGCS